MTTSHLSLKTPLGDMTLFEGADAKGRAALVALEWGRAPGSSKTPLLGRAERQLKDYFAGRRRAFDLPLAPAGTAFQKAVWREMARIPAGKTKTYGAIAEKLASGPRAVGTACGRNPLPILLPCHRVLGANGGLGGYTAPGGVETKAWLLALEAKKPPKSRA